MTIFSAVIETLSYLIVKLKKIEIIFSIKLIEYLAAFTTNCPTNKIVSDIGGSS